MREVERKEKNKEVATETVGKRPTKKHIYEDTDDKLREGGTYSEPERGHGPGHGQGRKVGESLASFICVTSTQASP